MSDTAPDRRAGSGRADHRRKEPPVAGPLPESLELVLGDQIYIAKDALSPALRNRLVRLAAFQNPEFYKAQAMRLPTYDKPRVSASVRRLVRDGVDAPLANLFVHAARHVPPDAEGVNRARSASEAFLYRRLETLPGTAGRFRLNVELPIPFDGWGRMEVDLLCAEARVAVELDGAQHLADPDAYRRDRRKDLLLQENGYFVLRFLAEDVGTHLDDVLDAILRTLSHRQRRQS